MIQLLTLACRVQDVRATEKDKVKIFTSFRPGDIVRAQVVRLSSSSSSSLFVIRHHRFISLCDYCKVLIF